MTRLIRSLRRGTLAAALSFVVPAMAAAQDLPDAQDIIDRYVEAVGGREVVTAAMATRASGSLEIPGMGITGEMVVVRGPDGSMTTKVTIPGMGEMLSGYTGEVGWSMDAMTGARLLEGGELETMREQADPLYEARDASLFTSFETVGEKEYDGEACWEVHYVFKSNRESSECFSKDSGLVIASISTQESPMGSVEVVSRIGEYQRFGNMLVPTSVKQNMMGQEQIVKIGNVEFGDIDLSLLEPPTAILTLIGAGG